MAERRALLVANRKALSGAADLGEGLARLSDAQILVTERAAHDPLEIPDILRSEGREADLIILAGGDGTMNLAAEALLELGRPLGILPIGTANDLARTLEIPLSVPDACAVIAAGRVRAIDLGRANGKHFFNVASVGLSAEVTRHHQGRRKRLLRVLSYPLSVWDAFHAIRPFRVRIRCDGQETRVRTIQVTVGNGRHYGGGMTMIEDAAIDDGQLDVYCIKPLSFWALMALFPALRWGRLRDRAPILVWRGCEVLVRTRRRLPVNTDGEITTHTPVEFTVASKALTVFVP